MGNIPLQKDMVKKKDGTRNFKEKVSDTLNKEHFALPSKFPLQVAPFTNMIPHKKWMPNSKRKLSRLCSVYLDVPKGILGGVRQGTPSDAQGILLILTENYS